MEGLPSLRRNLPNGRRRACCLAVCQINTKGGTSFAGLVSPPRPCALPGFPVPVCRVCSGPGLPTMALESSRRAHGKAPGAAVARLEVGGVQARKRGCLVFVWWSAGWGYKRLPDTVGFRCSSWQFGSSPLWGEGISWGLWRRPLTVVVGAVALAARATAKAIIWG